MEDNIISAVCPDCNVMLRPIIQLGLVVDYEDADKFVCTKCGSIFNEHLELIPGAKLLVD